jgi:hypothetical protein
MIDEDVRATPTPPTSPPPAPGHESRWKRLLNQTPADFQRRRERHHRRPIIVRIVVAVCGGILAIPGLLLVLLAPDVGLPLLIVGLGLLSLEFDWAARLLGQVIRWTTSARMWFRGLSGPRRILVSTVALAIIAVIAWVLFLR